MNKWMYFAPVALFTGACGGPATPAGAVSADTSTLRCDVRDYGAKGDGVTKDTAAIQAAIDACAGQGGEVHLSNGTFLSGTIRLGSKLSFVVDPGATLLGTQDDADYPDQHPATDNSQLNNCRKALIYGENVHDVHLTGAGVIDGNGTAAKWNNPPEATRPMAVFIVLSSDVTVDTLTVKNSAMWTLVTMETDNVTIRGVTIDSTVGATRDGIDIVDDHHVLVENCTIKSEDDSVCLKSGVLRGVDDVTVRNVHILQSGVANSMKLGTAGYGSFTNITFDTIDAAHADKAAMAVESVDGATISNVTFANIAFHDVGTPFFVLIGDRGSRPAGAPRHIGSIDGVQFQNVTGDTPRHTWGSIISGLTENGVTYPVRNVAFTDVNVTVQGHGGGVPNDPPEYAGQYPDPNLWGDVPGYGLFLRHVDGMTFTRSSIKLAGQDDRVELHAVDTANITLPPCDVTFVLRTDINQPTFDPNTDAFALAGNLADPAGNDPLGGWQGPGLTLTTTTPDATGRSRFIGHATFAQGSTVDLKGTLHHAGAVQWEREGLGNRRIVIPHTPTATIALDWQN
jgi:hypothetical protein